MKPTSFQIFVKNCGIRRGDTVRVLRSVPDFHLGWHCRWVESMTEKIGMTFVVDSIDNEAGIFDGYSWYPPHALEKVSDGEAVDLLVSRDAYQELQAQAGLKEGDKVKVLRVAKGQESGWDCEWVADMDEYVGQVGEIKRIDDRWGPSVKFKDGEHYFFPFFVLDVVKPKRVRTPRIRTEGKVGDSYVTCTNDSISIDGLYSKGTGVVRQVTSDKGIMVEFGPGECSYQDDRGLTRNTTMVERCYFPPTVLCILKKAPTKKAKIDPKSVYVAAQNASGLKVGDLVKVARTAHDYDMGWQNMWTHSMTKFVGQIGKITEIADNGVYMRFGTEGSLAYPFFVLAKEPAPQSIKIEVLNDILKIPYDITVTKDEVRIERSTGEKITLGCLRISNETLKKIVEAKTKIAG